MSCLSPESIKYIVIGVVLSITAIGGFGALALIAWRMNDHG